MAPAPAPAQGRLWAIAALAALANLAEGHRRHHANFFGLRASEDSVAADHAPPGAGSTGTYLIATFPEMRQVAYCRTPDNVWRPLVTGDVARPSGVAVDSENARLFVSDPDSTAIWHWALGVRPGGLLETQGARRAAVQGFHTSRIAVNSIGDLYFVGRAAPPDGAAAAAPFDAIYRMDAQSIARGDPLRPAEVYSRADTGSPDSLVWAPSGLAVDSFSVYWGNAEAGTAHGSVVKGSRTNDGLAAKDQSVVSMSSAFPEVRGLAATGTHVFFVTPAGVHGVLKTESGASNPGLVATGSRNLSDVAWDGGNSLYVAAAGDAGAVYTLPALDSQAHSLEWFADSPGVQSIAIYLH